MSASFLITWATRSGSTEEVARQLAAVLIEKGVAVDARPMREVQSLDGYRAAILGAPLYIGRLHRDARRFLAAHRDELCARRVALFVLGPVHAEEGEFATAERQLRRELKKYPWFAPAVQQIFGGRWDPSKLGFPLTWMPALRNVEASDARDWVAIRAWAATLCDRLAAPATA
ncbi:MAG TPA: flavodoxin domain-containing protein [Acidobacteriaceae bacterium]|nr:flavodoxin domain-containing protein [Acidobacteriaceae bacterium]